MLVAKAKTSLSTLVNIFYVIFAFIKTETRESSSEIKTETANTRKRSEGERGTGRG